MRNPFRRDVIVTDSCGEPALGIPIEAAPIITSPSGATVITPISPGAPVELEAAPVEELIPAPTTGQLSPNRKTLYETYKPSGGTTSSRPAVPAPAAASVALTDPLADLPPLQDTMAAPAEEITPPVAPEAVAESPAASSATNDQAQAGAEAPAQAPAPLTELPPRPADAVPVSLAEGMARFMVFDPGLAGGSVPSEAGWKFLAEEKGYRSVLDLRPHDEVQPGDSAAALHHGLRYLVLPVTPSDLTMQALARFDQEIEQVGARPLYVFDNDGIRPAVLWYLHLVLTEGRDESAASDAVADLGPFEGNPFWLAAQSLIQQQAEQRAQAATALPAVAPAAEPMPATPADIVAPLPDLAPPADLTPPPPDGAQAAPPSLADGVHFGFGPAPGDELTTETDPTAWHPYGVMALAGLGIPLALVGRNALSFRSLRRASLMGPKREPKALPAASDARS